MLTILLVDDEQHVRETIKSMCNFAELGIGCVLEAENGRQALEIMFNEKPHIVITDMQMPLYNGIKLLQKSCEKGFEGKIIVLSGFDSFEYVREGLRAGAFDYLLKPINPFELVDTIKRAAACFSVSSEEIDFLDEIKMYIEKNFAEDIYLELFSKKYFMTKEYILRKYKDKFNTGIYEQVMNMRMKEAKRLLMDTGCRIQEIGFKVGFKDNHYFSKAFKNYFGVSPRQMRTGNSSQNDDESAE